MNYITLKEQYIRKTFNLSRNGHKALNVVTWLLMHDYQKGNFVILDKYSLAEFLNKTNKYPNKIRFKAFTSWINELIDAEILEKTDREFKYKVNTKFMTGG